MSNNASSPRSSLLTTDTFNYSVSNHTADTYNTDDSGFVYAAVSWETAQEVLSQPYCIAGLVIAVTATTANAVSLAALIQIRHLWTSHMRILLSLVASDLLVDVSYIVHIINHITNPTYYPGSGPRVTMLVSRCTYMEIKALNTTALNITTLNILALAINHYIAVLQPLHAARLMSKKRCIVMIVCIWIVALLAGFSDFISPFLDQRVQIVVQETYNLCEVAWFTHYQEEFLTFGISFVCFIAMLYIYLHIYCEIKGKHPTNTLATRQGPSNKKALVTTLLILGSFLICWLPSCIYAVTMIIITKGGTEVSEYINSIYFNLFLLDRYLFDLMLLNTLCDPIIYVVRIMEIRKGYRMLFRCCFRLNVWETRRRRSSGSSWSHVYSSTSWRQRSSKSGETRGDTRGETRGETHGETHGEMRGEMLARVVECHGPDEHEENDKRTDYV